MNKPITSGSKIGICNICGAAGQLTEDHVPPKGSIKPEKVGIKNIIEAIEKADFRSTRISQNGVKFRSLCSVCNTNRLGRNLDPDLNQFSCKVAQIFRNQNHLVFPNKIDIRLKPQKIARAVIGHLLAAEIREDMRVPPVSEPMPDLMRDYFLNPSADLPKEFNLYVWPYRSQQQVILRCAGLVEVVNGTYSILGDFLKYFPVAFWLTYKAPIVFQEGMRDREIIVRGHEIDDFNTIVLGTDEQDTFRPDWPEKADKNEILIVDRMRCFLSDKTTNI